MMHYVIMFLPIYLVCCLSVLLVCMRVVYVDVVLRFGIYRSTPFVTFASIMHGPGFDSTSPARVSSSCD